MPLIEAVMWLACRTEEEERRDRFLAALNGAELKSSGRSAPEKTASLRDVMSLVQSKSRGQSGLTVERVRVSPEELARRRQMTNDK